MPLREEKLCAGECYHVFNRGVRRGQILFSRDNYGFFLRRVRENLCPDHAEVIAYCLMPNHYHFLVWLLTEEFSERMHAASTSYAKALNKQRKLSGALFESRFKAKHVDAPEYLVHLTRYIHLNPVAAKLVVEPADWEFSSYPEYVGTRDGTLPSPDKVIAECGGRDAYRRFVESDIPRDSPNFDHLLFDE